MARVVVAEDDDRQRRLMVEILEAEGHEVIATRDGGEAIEVIRSRHPEIAVLDVMMPGLTGHDVCRAIAYERLDTAVLMVTALGDADDVVLGLEIGADDYLAKPYSPRELAARVRALARRFAKSQSHELQVGNLIVRPDRATAAVDDTPLVLTKKEFAVLAVLSSSVERVWSRQQILDEAFGFDYDGLERSVDMHVVALRRKLGSAGCVAKITTVHGIGYRIEEPS